MKYALRSTLLALVAVFALGAVVAGAASAAEPEFKPIPAKKKFTSTSGAVAFHDGIQEITCTSSSTSGEITGATTIGKVIIKYSGCQYTFARESCPIHSEGAKGAGEIVTYALKGQLGSVSTKEATSGVGVLLATEGAPIDTWAIVQSTCHSQGRIQGEVAAEVTPIGKKQTTLGIVFAALPEGQKINEITIGGKKREAGGLELFSGLLSEEATDSLTFEEALEVT